MYAQTVSSYFISTMSLASKLVNKINNISTCKQLCNKHHNVKKGWF